MVSYVCDSTEVESLLRRITELAERAGAWFHPGLTLCCRKGEMWLESSLSPASTEAVALLPPPAMVPLEGVELGVKNDEFILRAAPAALTPEQSGMLEAFVRLYNLTGKPKGYREHYPAMWAASDPDLFEAVFAARPGLKGGSALSAYLEGGSEERLMVSGFLQTRQYKDTELGYALMPVIDLANHHPGVLGFSSDPPGYPGRALALCHSRPKAGSRECFVRYDRYDAMDLYLIYGYPERETPYVRSVPLTIPLEGLGTVAVEAKVSGYIKGDLPDELAPLRPFLPYFEKESDDVIRLSQLLVPVRFMPGALRQVLGMVIHQMSPGAGAAARRRAVSEAERAVISRNIAFYEGLARAFEAKAGQARSEARLACGLEVTRIQLGLLKAYRPDG